MLLRRLGFMAFAAAVALLVGSVAAPLPLPQLAAAPGVDPSAREWNQARGNAARTSSSVVTAVRGDAVEAWRAELPGEMLSEPVTWGGTIYVVTRQGRTRALLAIRATTGETEATKLLGRGDEVDVGVWSGMVIVSERGKMKAYKHLGDEFKNGWSASGKWSGEPCIYRGKVFAAESGMVHVLDAVTGRKLGKTEGYSAHELAAHGSAKQIKKEIVLGSCSAWYDPEADAVQVQVLGAIGNKAYLTSIRAKGVDDGKPELEYPRTRPLGELTEEVDPKEGLWGLLAGRLDPKDGPGKGAWLVLSTGPTFKSGSRGRYLGDNDSAGLASALHTGAAMCLGSAFGFDKTGELKRRTLGKAGSRTVIKKKDLPKGAATGRATAAGETLFFGNWALDPAEGRILWARPDDAPVTPTIPCGDGRMVFATSTNVLACVAERSVAEASQSATASAGEGDGEGEAEEERPRVERPRHFAGVILRDGRQIEGTYRRKAGHKVVITPKEGDELTVYAYEVLVAREDLAEMPDIQAEEYALYNMWLDAIYGEYGDALEALFETYADAKLVTEARRVLALARGMGIGEARANALGRKLSGMRETSMADKKAKKFAEQEQAVHQAAYDGLVEGAAWCKDCHFPTAGTVLLMRADEIQGAEKTNLDQKIGELVPPEAPFASETNPVEKWKVWAEELLPASAAFMGPDDAGWSPVRNAEPWTEETLGFRTPNLILFCRDRDPVVCGMLVRNGEGAVRANQVLLKDGARDTVPSDAQRLQVRVHRNRAEYLKEKTPHGGALPWSAGYYSPAEGVSRFYVTRSGRNNEPLGRGLHEVLAHELTHHYISERWIGKGQSRGGSSAGYWVVEGMARFVEDQSVEMGRRGLRFDDKRVGSLDATAQVAFAPKPLLFPIETFVEMNASKFHSDLNGPGGMEVKLKNSLKTVPLNMRAIYYEQAGALVYFLMNECGDEGREKLVAYMNRYYRGRAPSQGWNALGFESAEDMETQFKAFLKTLL